MDDKEIIALYVQRDESAIEQTAIKYGKRLRGVSYGILKDAQTAEECENDTYLKAWEAIPPQNPATYFFVFLAKITRNLSLNCCRDRSRLKRNAFVCELSNEMEQCIPAPDDTPCQLEAEQLAKAINSFLEKLDADKRSLFLRRYWYLDSVADIAKRFSWSESKVKTTLSRLRVRLHDFLQKEGYLL